MNIESTLLSEPPTRLCCGKPHFGSTCADGYTMCQLCFDRFAMADLSENSEGLKQDVCRFCWQEEMRVEANQHAKCAYENMRFVLDHLEALDRKHVESAYSACALASILLELIGRIYIGTNAPDAPETSHSGS